MQSFNTHGLEHLGVDGTDPEASQDTVVHNQISITNMASPT